MSSYTSAGSEAERTASYEALRAAAEAIILSTNEGMVPVMPNNAMTSSSSSYLLPESQRLGQGHRQIIVSEDIVSGAQYQGRMSPVRRFFLLFVTFDVLFTSLLWIITVIVTGREVEAALKQQVLDYTIHDSMFDCVVIAFVRFLLCLLFYGIIDQSHWWTIAVTTAGTSAFLIAKVFLYQWTKFGPITFDVMLVLMSFVLAWAELWFLDFRVVPLESKAKEIVDSINERSRLLLIGGGRGRVGGGNYHSVQQYLESNWGGSVANFYSPLESPDFSEDEVEEDTGVTIPRKFIRKQPLNAQESEYRILGEETLKTAWFILNSLDWKLEKSLPNGDTVHTKTINKKKVFKLTGTVDLPPRLLLEELFFKIESVPEWNPTLVECKLIQAIDSHTDISYQVCAEAAGGVVKTRDFVNLRHWDVIEDGIYISSGVSIKHPAMPPQPNKVRGDNGPGAWVMRPVPEDPCQTVFQWLLDTDLKGWIPQTVIDSALSGAQLDYIEHIRNYAKTLHESGAVKKFLARQQ